MSDPAAILALDISSKTGWCVGVPGAVPVTGVWMLPRYVLDEGRCLAALGNELADAIFLHQPVEVWMEAPLPAGAQTHAASASQQLELAGIVKETCYRWERPLRPVHSGTVRKSVLGRGNKVSKDDVVAWCVGQGWKVADHNSADAAMVWAHACKQQQQRAAA
jgi:hypothetical protein